MNFEERFSLDRLLTNKSKIQNPVGDLIKTVIEFSELALFKMDENHPEYKNLKLRLDELKNNYKKNF